MSDELVREWVQKAEEDWTALERLQAGGLHDVPGVIAFHAQQCVEKYLKALLQRQGIEPPRTHHLPALLDELSAAGHDVDLLRGACEILSPYAVYSRYPGLGTTAEDAAEALQDAALSRRALRRMLDLPG
ncbi:MAG: HEPN domain-containing protein [Candidatus Brocadiae bacterium]|nr:HEPN domain-containing protein [Candidatus Brocadiia bacterium]